MTKFGRQKLVRFWAFRLTHPYQSHYFLLWEIFVHGFVFLELALTLFEAILTHAYMNMIKALFVINYISQTAYLVIKFSFCRTPLSFIDPCRFLWTHITNFEHEKQCLYPSHRTSGALFIMMIYMVMQVISIGVSGFMVWL